MVLVPESQEDSQRYADYGLEATQLSQPVNTQASHYNSQVEPRRAYWAILIPTNAQHDILKLPWGKPRLQIGRGPSGVGNDIILQEKRVSNRHCRISLGLPKSSSGASGSALVQSLKDGEAEPEVWIEDLKSSNGTFVNGQKITKRRLLQHGDEISLGHVGTAEHHEVRYIFRSVGCKGARFDGDRPGEVYERYQMLATLGKGTFAEVKKAVDVETGDMRAIKQIVKHRFQHDAKTLNLFQREINICTELTHENICRLLDWYEDPQHICLVLEYVDGGDLLDYIMNWPEPGLPEQEAADLTFQICRAMAYCHENGVTHRDLKPENILLTKETESQARMIKVADFGLAKMVHQGTMLVSMVGTPQYLAPEVVMQDKQRPGYENVVDSWSIGTIVYSMLTKALPFDDDTQAPMEQRIRSRFTLDFDRETLSQHNVSDAGVDFIARLLEKDPAKRMTLTEALTHEWLAGPSSLPVEPSQTLGGDSMWNIQSFDSAASDWRSPSPSATGADIEDGERTPWTRPMTMSGTNFDSERSSNGDSFSQPMEKLRLNTAAAVANELSVTKEMTESPGPSRSNTPGANTTMDADNSMDTEEAEDAKSPANGKMDLDTKTTTLPLKRNHSLFSSGSLSPAPESQQNGKAREKTPQPPAVKRAMRSSTARVPISSPATRTRSRAPASPVEPKTRATRTRKSVRQI